MSKESDLDKAIALFRSGLSTRECEKKTGVNYKKVGREAKKRGVEKGDVSHLIDSVAANKTELVSLPETVRQVVTDKADELATDRLMIRSMTNNNMIGVADKLENHKELDMLAHKNAQDLIDKASITLGVNPRHAQSQINMQQNLTESKPEESNKIVIEIAQPKELHSD